MEKLADKVANTPKLNEKYKKVICDVCKKEFDVLLMPWADTISASIRQTCDECVEEDNKKRKAKEAEREQIRQQEAAKQYIIREIPKKYQDIESDRKDLIDKYVGYSLFITGSAGVGKTVLMATIAKILRRDFRHVKWISYPAFIMELQSMFKKDAVRTEYRGQVTPFDEAEDVAKFEGWLCIDDIGAEKLTDYVRQITYFIINEREQRMLPTIITSNFTLAQIDEMVDPRVSSRIAGMCETIKLTGADRRIRKI